MEGRSGTDDISSFSRLNNAYFNCLIYASIFCWKVILHIRKV
jgi:hypothetical protein